MVDFIYICIFFDDTCYKFENTYFDNKIIKITFPCESAWKQSILFRQNNIEKMITDRYDRTMFLLSSVFFKGYENLDSVYKAIRHMNQQCRNRRLRVTGDTLVSNLNKITQKIADKKFIMKEGVSMKKPWKVLLISVGVIGLASVVILGCVYLRDAVRHLRNVKAILFRKIQKN